MGGVFNFNCLINVESVMGWGFEVDFEVVFVECVLVMIGVSYNNIEIDDFDFVIVLCVFWCIVFDLFDGLGNVFIDGNLLL